MKIIAFSILSLAKYLKAFDLSDDGLFFHFCHVPENDGAKLKEEHVAVVLGELFFLFVLILDFVWILMITSNLQ